MKTDSKDTHQIRDANNSRNACNSKGLQQQHKSRHQLNRYTSNCMEKNVRDANDSNKWRMLATTGTPTAGMPVIPWNASNRRDATVRRKPSNSRDTKNRLQGR